MVSVHEALRLVLEDLPVIGCERVMLRDAHGRVLGEAVAAARDVPPFRNSAMDGYAVRSLDTQAAPSDMVRLGLIETIGAGSSPTQPVAAGTATKIMTGSPLPDGADAVVRLEDAVEEGNTVRVRRAVAPGANVREPGEDMRAGEVVLEAGRVIRPADIGLLASLGAASVSVRRRPRVAIIATGDELVDVGESLGPGQIVNSNAYTLAAAVEEAGAAPVVLGIARDTPDALRGAFADAFACDAVVSTGGVSVGNFDYVRRVQTSLGVREKFWRVAQKPGKPLSFGLQGRVPVFGLPGNPVSSLVCFYLYALPALRKLAGAARLFLPSVEALAEDDIPTSKGMTEFVRCRLTLGADGYRAAPAGSQSSGVLRSMSLGDALVVGEPSLDLLPRGSRVRAIMLLPAAVADTPPF